jgi:hypothetical protein
MFDFVKTKVAELVDTLGHPISMPKVDALHPLDDPEEWKRVGSYQHPADINIVQEQKWIDQLMGTTHDNQPIYKLVWNGDRNYWYEFFVQWDALGRPTAPPLQRPRIRYKVLRDPVTNRPVRDVFPPRWLILTRLEPEQYAHSWKKESYSFAPEIGTYKQIRPDEPPSVFWLWYATIARHTAHCCTTANKERRKCYGRYAPPSYAREMLTLQHQADLEGGTRSVYEKITGGFASEIEDENTGYAFEMAELQVESEVFIENPMALLGVEGSLRADVDLKQARQMVKDFYDREIEEQAKLL